MFQRNFSAEQRCSRLPLQYHSRSRSAFSSMGSKCRGTRNTDLVLGVGSVFQLKPSFPLPLVELKLLGQPEKYFKYLKDWKSQEDVKRGIISLEVVISAVL